MTAEIAQPPLMRNRIRAYLVRLVSRSRCRVIGSSIANGARAMNRIAITAPSPTALPLSGMSRDATAAAAPAPITAPSGLPVRSAR